MTDSEALEPPRSRDLLGVARATKRRERSTPAPGRTDDPSATRQRRISGCGSAPSMSGGRQTYVLFLSEETDDKIQETLDLAGSCHDDQGGLHPDLRHRPDRTLRRSKSASTSPSTAERSTVAEKRASPRATSAAPQGAGSAAGGGAELVNRVREQGGRQRTRASGWTSCARPNGKGNPEGHMMFGSVEVARRRTSNADDREPQDETEAASIPWSFSAGPRRKSITSRPTASTILMTWAEPVIPEPAASRPVPPRGQDRQAASVEADDLGRP